MVMSRHVELPKRLADAIKRTWPDGVVEMMDLEEETSVHKACSKLQTRLSRLPGSNLVFERAAGGGPRWSEGADPDDDPPEWTEPTCSYHLFFLSQSGSGQRL
jgi:hypothetical protein